MYAFGVIWLGPGKNSSLAPFIRFDPGFMKKLIRIPIRRVNHLTALILFLAMPLYGYSDPAIHYAVSTGNPKLVQILIAAGADVNAKGRFDRTALHYANKKGMAKILLEHGAIVDPPTDFGETPLHWAAQGINSMDRQVDLVEFAETLIKYGADVNRQTGPGRANKTPLNYAALSNNLAVARALIAHGAGVEGGGSSPLGDSGGNGDYVEMAQLLVENGAGVNTRSTGGWYPLHPAASRCNIKVTNFLLARGANPNALNGDGKAALHLAAGSDYCVTTVEALLANGADLNSRDRYGSTALSQAAFRGAVEVVKLLLARGADVNASSNEGYTSLHTAISTGANGALRTVVETLLQNGANTNAKNSDQGVTPFHKALERGDIEIVKLLLKYGADANATSKSGVTSLYFARNSPAILELIKEHGAK